MTAVVELRLRGSMDHLRIAWQTGETLLESIPFDEDPEGTRYNFLLAVQEMVTNVLRHAYGGVEGEDDQVVVEFTAADSGMAVVIRDHGPEFNPVQAETPQESDAMPQSGGYGIMIAKMVMDEIGYTRDGAWNVLRMFKSAKAPVGQPQD